MAKKKAEKANGGGPVVFELAPPPPPAPAPEPAKVEVLNAGQHLQPPPKKPWEAPIDKPFLTLVERQYLLRMADFPKHQHSAVAALYAISDQKDFLHVRRFLDYFLETSCSVGGATAQRMVASIAGHAPQPVNPAMSLNIVAQPDGKEEGVKRRGLWQRLGG